jgi:hypothetical protein
MKQDKVIIKPLLNTWGYKKYAGYWDLLFPSEFICSSIEQQKESYVRAVKMTLDIFYDFARAYEILIISKSESDLILLEWQPEEEYEKYTERALKKIKDYSDEIYNIEIKVELNVFVYTEKYPKKPIRAWVRCFDTSIEMGKFSIDISTKESEPSMCFMVNHTLFYPFSYQGNENNNELFELNQTLLEEAFKSWEEKFNSEIEADGLPGIYKYGFLPEDEWNKS